MANRSTTANSKNSKRQQKSTKKLKTEDKQKPQKKFDNTGKNEQNNAATKSI